MSPRSGSGATRGQPSHRSTVATPNEREIVITRQFDAPRDVVFDAWTSSERVRQWWDPSGTPLSTCDIDLRPGGAFCFVPAGPDGETRRFHGTYREVVAPVRLVFTTPGPSGGESVGTITFSERTGGTTLTLTIACQSSADRDALLRLRVDVGTTRTLDNLERHLSADQLAVRR